MTTQVEHPYREKTEFQHPQDKNFDLAQQLQKTKRENSSLQAIIKILQEDKTMLQETSPFSRLRTLGLQHELRRENISLSSQVQHLQNEIYKQNNKRQSEMQKLREENSKKTEVSQLEDKNDKMQKIQAENCKINIKNRLLQQENNNVNIEIQQLRKDDTNQKTKIFQLQQERDNMSDEIEKLQQENNKMKVEIQQIQQEDDKKKLKIFKLQQEKDNTSDEIQKLRQENNNIKIEIQQLRQDDNKKKTEISQLQQEKDNTTDEIQNLRQENNKMKVEIQQIRQEDNKKKTEISQLQQEKNNTTDEIQNLRQENNNIKIEIQQLRQEDSNLKIEMQQLQEENDDMSTEMRNLRQENNDLTVENQHLQESTECNYLIEKGSVNISREILGKGAWGAVYKGNFHGTEVAVKEYHEIIVSPYNMGMLEREINIASQCRHPNLLQFICATKNDKNRLLIVTELMDMALRTLIEQSGMDELRLEDEEAKLISMDVARGLSYLHSKTPNPIIHRDVSSANVLLSVDKNGAVRRAKISDYGSANFAKACNTAYPGAAIYAAPEARQAQYDPKVNMLKTVFIFTNDTEQN